MSVKRKFEKNLLGDLELEAGRGISEKKTGELFGKLFPDYDDKAFLASLELFKKRFEENNFPLDWFKGKKCLDAGCGGGRYSIALSLLGAKEVIGIDLSEPSIKDARCRASQMGLSNVKFMVDSVESIPFSDSSFDCVIFSGVLQHVVNPCKVLDEIYRVTRDAGMVYMLVYAIGGIRWPLVQMLRPIAHRIGFEAMDRMVIRAGLQVNRRRTYLDDLFVPYIDFYSWQCLEGMLRRCGFSTITRWQAGRLDHEEDLESYYNDLKGFLDLFHTGVKGISEDLLEYKTLIESAEKLCSSAVDYVEKVREQVKEGVLSYDEAMEMIVGQGHHRVVAWRGI